MLVISEPGWHLDRLARPLGSNKSLSEGRSNMVESSISFSLKPHQEPKPLPPNHKLKISPQAGERMCSINSVIARWKRFSYGPGWVQCVDCGSVGVSVRSREIGELWRQYCTQEHLKCDGWRVPWG